MCKFSNISSFSKPNISENAGGAVFPQVKNVSSHRLEDFLRRLQNYEAS